MTTTPPTAAGASAEPIDDLRCVYECARGMLRYEDVDGPRYAKYVRELRDAIERVKESDAGYGDAAQTGEERAPGDITDEVMRPDGVCPTCYQALHVQPEDDATVRDAARYRYIRDFPPRARARKDGNTKPTLNDMWVAAFLRPQIDAIPQMDILEGELLDARVDAAIAAAESGE